MVEEVRESHNAGRCRMVEGKTEDEKWLPVASKPRTRWVATQLRGSSQLLGLQSIYLPYFCSFFSLPPPHLIFFAGRHVISSSPESNSFIIIILLKSVLTYSMHHLYHTLFPQEKKELRIHSMESVLVCPSNKT